MNRWKNYGLWVAVVSLLGLILGNYGLYTTLGLTSESFKAIADAILSILVMAGILSNPTTTGYTDK